MEPFSLIVATLAAKCAIVNITETIFGGLVEERSGKIAFDTLPKFTKKIIAQFKDTPVPVNHDLQKAILSSHWLATKVFVEQMLKKVKQSDALTKVNNVAKAQLKLLKDKNYLPSLSPDAYMTGELILKDENLQKATDLKGTVIAFHLAELRLLSGTAVNLQSYLELEQNIRTGYENLQWFELACAFLNELLKGDNNKAKDAYQNQELAKIGLEVSEIKGFILGIKHKANDYVNAIGEERFEELKTLISNELQEIKGSLNRIEEGIDDLKKGQNEIKEILINGIQTKTTKNLTSIPSLGTFIGRADDLKRLEKTLENANQVVLVNGLGGIGKTTLAKAYVHQNYKDFDHIAWVSVIGKSIKEAFVNTTYDTIDLQNVQLTQGDTDARFGAIMRVLRQLQGEKNLLVIDNAETDIDDISDELPSVTHWRILLTSRDNLDGYAVLPLDELSPQDALLLFKEHYKGNETDEKLQKLLEAINYHTLTVELLAKTLEKSNDDFNLKELLDKLNNRQLDDEKLRKNIKTEHWNAKQTQLFKHLLATFELSNKTDYEVLVLKQFTALPPEPQPIRQLKEWLKIDENTKKDFDKAIEDLHTEGWLKRTRNEKGETCFTLHRLIQDMVHYQHPIVFEDIEALIYTFDDFLYFDESTNFSTKFQYLSPAEYVLNTIPDAFENNVIASLNNNIGIVFKQFDDLKKAAKYLRKSLQIHENQKYEDTIALAQSNLATVLIVLADYTGAKKLLEKAKISNEKNFGEEHLNTADSYSNLALVLFNLKELQNAVILFEKAYKVYRNLLGEQHPSTKTVKGNLDFVREKMK